MAESKGTARHGDPPGDEPRSSTPRAPANSALGRRGSGAGNSPESPDGVVLFDGHCGLCQASVRFLLPRDPRGRLRFASLQSDAGRRAIRESGLDPAVALPGKAPIGGGAIGSHGERGETAGSVLFLQDGRLFRRSSAALRILRALGPPWSLASVFLLVPRPLRDWAYDFIARRRYRWFGHTETCMVPPADYDQRFLGRSEPPKTGPSA